MKEIIFGIFAMICLIYLICFIIFDFMCYIKTPCYFRKSKWKYRLLPMGGFMAYIDWLRVTKPSK